MNDRLFRSRQHRVFGGVAGGLGQYLNIDPILVRIIFVIITFINGLGLLLYIILWIVIPEEETKQSSNNNVNDQSKEPFTETANATVVNDGTVPAKKGNGNGRVVAGVILIGLGVVFLAERFFPYIDFSDMLPLVLVVIGVLLLVNSFRNKKADDHER